MKSFIIRIVGCMTLLACSGFYEVVELMADEPKSAAQTEPQKSRGKPAPGPTLVDGKQTILPISRETTYFTGPLDKHGFVDYIEALNLSMDSTLPAEQNAFVVYLSAMPADGEPSPEVVREMCQKLNVPVPTLQPCHYDFQVYLSKKHPIDILADGDAKTIREEFLSSEPESVNKPWKAIDNPEAKAWIDQVSPGLNIIKVGTQRPGYYGPYLKRGDGKEPELVVSIMLPFAQQYRAMAKAFRGRINLNLGEGNYVAAKDDLVALHRLARDAGRSLTLIEQLIGFSIDGVGFQADIDFANLCPDAELLKTYQAELKQLPQMYGVVKSIDVCERVMGLDFAQMFARRELGLVSSENVQQMLGSADVNKMQALITLSIDAKYFGAEINPFYDRMVEIMQLPRAERLTAVKAFEADNQDLLEDATSADQILLGVLSAQKRTELISKVILGTVGASIATCMSAQESYQTRQQIVDLALALNRYRHDHGMYPDTLKQLTPTYTTEIKDDVFANAPLHYTSDGKVYKLYSIGRDAIDDGGISSDTLIGSSRRSDDIVATSK
jgi:hypothetical protein